MKRLLEEALEAERTDWLGVGRYVRDEAERQDYRNGYYRRDLGTRLGLVRGRRAGMRPLFGDQPARPSLE